MGSEIQEIKNTIVQRLPARVQVAKVEFEGPEVVIYTKNPEIITENGGLIRDLAKDIRKRIIILFLISFARSLISPPFSVMISGFFV